MLKLTIPIAIITILAIAATFAVGLLLVATDSRTNEFWISLAIIALAEILAAFSFANIATARRERAEPFKIGAFSLFILYTLFTIGMAIVMLNTPAAAHSYLWVAHIVIFAIVAILALMTGMARDTKNTADARLAAARIPKAGFQATLAAIADNARDKNCSSDIIAKITRLQGMARYAAETLAGAESADEQVRQSLENLGAEINAPATDGQQKNLEALARRAEQALQLREAMMKSLRG